MSATSKRLFCVIAVIFLLAFIFSIYPSNASTSSNEHFALSAVNNAEQTLVSAYQIVRETEELGVDVSDFLIQLNVAGRLLSQANMSFRRGNFDSAIQKATLSSNIGEEVKDQADLVNKKARLEASNRLGFIMFGSVLSVVLTLILGYLSWRMFKKRYYKRILKMRPEIVGIANES